jgi:serine/threonine-protein kinase
MPSPLRSAGSDVVALGDERRVLIGAVLGKGTSATVHRGILESESGLRRPVAVKVFAPVSSDDEAKLEGAIARTAQRAACIVHPNVVAVHDLGKHKGAPFVVTELVEGVPLPRLTSRYVERAVRPPLDVALFIAVEIGHALDGARRARDFHGVGLGVAHLGLAPNEVLLSWRGEVKVTDFELSLARAASSSVRNLREIKGRVSYMAPEVAAGDRGDARSDVFALGTMMREMFVGPRFPRGITSAEAVRLAREGYVHPVCFRPDLPPYLDAVLQRALEIDPEARFPHAGALVFELRRIALAMGVGDGRDFLRRTLQRELAEETSEVTREIAGAPARERAREKV